MGGFFNLKFSRGDVYSCLLQMGPLCSPCFLVSSLLSSIWRLLSSFCHGFWFVEQKQHEIDYGECFGGGSSENL